jgi:hypothetical protein
MCTGNHASESRSERVRRLSHPEVRVALNDVPVPPVDRADLRSSSSKAATDAARCGAAGEHSMHANLPLQRA